MSASICPGRRPGGFPVWREDEFARTTWSCPRELSGAGAAGQAPYFFGFRAAHQPGDADVGPGGNDENPGKKSQADEESHLLVEMREPEHGPAERAHQSGGNRDLQHREKNGKGSQAAEALAKDYKQHQ